MTVGRSWRRNGRFFAWRDAKITPYWPEAGSLALKWKSEGSDRLTAPLDPVAAGAWPVWLRLAADDGDGAGQDRAHGNHDQGDGPVEETAKGGELSLRHDEIPFLV